MKRARANATCRGCGKDFMACSHCGKKESWRAYACSIECAEKYIAEVEAARGELKKEDFYSPRTDISQEQVKEIMDKPIEEVNEIAKAEIESMGYGEELKTLGYGGTVDLINEDLRAEQQAANAIEAEAREATTKARRVRKRKDTEFNIFADADTSE